MSPLRHLQEMQDLVRSCSPGYKLEELTQFFAPRQEIEEMLKRCMVSTHIQDLIDGWPMAAQANYMQQYLSKESFVGLDVYHDTIRQASGMNKLSEAMNGIAGVDVISDASRFFEQELKTISAQQEMLDALRRQSFGGLSVADFTRQLEEANPAIRVMEEARKSLDRLLPTFGNIDFSQFEVSEIDEQDTKRAARTITQDAAQEGSFQEAVERIVVAILAQQKPTVRLMLWVIFRKVVDMLIAGAIGAAMGHYAPAVLGESPQAAKKAVQESARNAVGSRHLLVEYRYVSTTVLIVRQNPRARSPEVGRLSFGKAVKVLKKETDFTLVLWTDQESGAEIQGWVFSRYLSKFN